MRVIEYTPACFPEVSAALSGIGVANALLHSEDFLRHQYFGHPSSRLWLLRDRNEQLAGLLAVEQVRLEIAGTEIAATVGSNTYSIVPGAFAFLLLHWMRSADVGLILPGNPNLEAIVSNSSRWHRVAGLRAFHLNWSAASPPNAPAWRKALRPLVRRIRRRDPAVIARRVARMHRGVLDVHEVSEFSDDMLCRKGSFGFRAVADLDYLNWRYCTDLAHVCYRIFRIVQAATTRGYVVLAEWPHRLVVAHCDGDDPEILARGVLLAIAVVNRGEQCFRQVALTSMHARMNAIYREHGFVPDPRERPFFISSFRDPARMFEPADGWLVNVDLGDYGALLGTHYTPDREHLISGGASR